MLERQPLQFVLLHVGVDEFIPKVRHGIDQENVTGLFRLIDDLKKIREGFRLRNDQLLAVRREQGLNKIRPRLGVGEGDRPCPLNEVGESDSDPAGRERLARSGFTVEARLEIGHFTFGLL